MKKNSMKTFNKQFIVLLLLLFCGISANAADDDLITQQITITLDTAGTLPKKIASDQKYRITNLKVSGPINGTDVRYLREMAGKDANGYSTTAGKLADLDLTDADIVAGGECYYKNYYAKNDTLGNHMFIGCNLKSIKLPNSVTNIGQFAFYCCSNLASVTIPNSVKNIGNYAFEGCSSLTSVNIPNSVKSIGEHTFGGCSSLTSVTIPNSVRSIGESTFSNCSSLTALNIPNSVTIICNWAFSGCKGLTFIDIPNSVKSIGDYAFAYCSGLTSITIPNFVTSIGESTFRGCSSLTSITIPNSVTSIGDYAFRDCSSLTSITIPNSVKSIGNNAFRDCSSLTKVIVEDIAAWCGIRFSSNSNPLSIAHHLYSDENTEIKDLKIPDGVTNIGDNAFRDCSSLTSITIPNSVTSIGHHAFNGCSGLTSVNLGNSVTSIGNDAFNSCSGLTSVTIPNSVTSIGVSTFSGCSGLTSVIIGENVESIDYYAFSGCSALVKLISLSTIPPTCSNNALTDINKQQCTLYVPKNSFDAYKVAEQWRNFYNMEEIENTGIGLPGSNGNNKIIKRYDTNGRMTDKPFKGLNILKMNDGTIKKVMVK